MNSKRLPGKVMLKVCDKTFLELMIERIKRSKELDCIIIATTTNPKDDIIENFCKQNKIEYFRGSEDDVLTRFNDVSRKIGADTIVRLNADCPTIDPKIIDKSIRTFIDDKTLDYVSTSFPSPRNYPDGFSVEVFSNQTLLEVFEEATKSYEREHVTPFIWRQPNRYTILRLNPEKNLANYRLNLDYIEDYYFLKKLFESLYPTNPFFTLEDIIQWLNQHPDILKINSKYKTNSIKF